MDHAKNIEQLAKLMDNQFTLFGFKFGLDPILGLFPVVGDIAPVLVSLYMIWYAKQQKAHSSVLTKMFINIGIDFGIGLIPLVGDAADFAIKSNQKNYTLLKKHVLEARVIEGEIVR